MLFTTSRHTRTSTLSLHAALPICAPSAPPDRRELRPPVAPPAPRRPSASAPLGRAPDHRARALHHPRDRKSTRLNSSHMSISYAVFCLKKKSLVTGLATQRAVGCG